MYVRLSDVNMKCHETSDGLVVVDMIGN